jgi:Ca2+:H+ antiporter
MHDRTRTSIAFAYVLPVLAMALGIALRGIEHAVPELPDWALVVVPVAATAFLLPTVFAALHHAEAVARRLGEPYGTLVLTIAVTTIEVAIIVSLMLHGRNNPTLAREAVFSVVMIVCAGVVGVCLMLGALRHRVQELQQQGTSAILAVLVALSVLALILPNHTGSMPHGIFTTGQLAFVSLVSVLLYGAFLFMQTVRHRTDFLDMSPDEQGRDHRRPPAQVAFASFILLFVGLAAIVMLAKQVAAGVEDGLELMGVAQPDAIVGALIAALVLLPESISAVRAALQNRLQKSLNIALGSALATIGLTIPAVAAVSLITDHELTLGLENGDGVLLMLTLLLSVVSFGTGRTNVLTGLVHLVVFATYLLLLVIP